MNLRNQYSQRPLSCTLALGAALLAGANRAPAATVAVSAEPVVVKQTARANTSEDHPIRIETVEPEGPSAKASPWLGVGTEECSEALAAQLGLNAGEGLVVSFIAPESPAAKAGLQKNDVLAEFEGQVLVHPTQLRKLIQMRKEGDAVKLTFYRTGKKQSLKVTLGKNAALSGEHWDELRALQQFKKFPIDETVREQMKNLRQSLAQAGLDRDTLNVEIRRSIEEVRKGIQEALRQATNAARTFGPAAREFQELARRGLDVDKDATVVVKSKQNSVKSIVKTDDSGTYVIVATPRKQLTAHDKAGQLLFDGSIETAEDQAKVPKEVWDKAKPMLEQLNEGDSEKPEAGNEAK